MFGKRSIPAAPTAPRPERAPAPESPMEPHGADSSSSSSAEPRPAAPPPQGAPWGGGAAGRGSAELDDDESAPCGSMGDSGAGARSGRGAVGAAGILRFPNMVLLYVRALVSLRRPRRGPSSDWRSLFCSDRSVMKLARVRKASAAFDFSETSSIIWPLFAAVPNS